MRFITLVYKNIARRRGRTLLTLAALSTAVAAVVSLVGISNGFARSFSDVYKAHGIDLVVSRKGAADRLSSGISAAAAAMIREIDTVRDAAELLLDTLSLEDEGIYGVPTMGMRPDCWLMDDYRLVSGRRLSAEGRMEVMLGSQLADRLRDRLGGQLVFFEDESFAIVGVFESYSAWENSSLLMPLNQLQRLTDRENQVTYVNVVLTDSASSADMHRVTEAIARLDERLVAMPTEDFVKTDTRMRLAKGMAWMTSSVALLIGAIGLFNTMMMSVYERTREIGVLRAIGWKRNRIVRMILAEAGLLSALAAVAGSLLGSLMTWGLSRAPMVAGTIPAAIDWSVIGQGLVIAMVIGVLGAAYPAIRAARLVPTEALRHE